MENGKEEITRNYAGRGGGVIKDNGNANKIDQVDLSRLKKEKKKAFYNLQLARCKYGRIETHGTGRDPGVTWPHIRIMQGTRVCLAPSRAHH